MPHQRLEAPAITGIPQTDGAIFTPAGNEGAIGTEGHGSDLAGMPLQPVEAATAHDIPQQNHEVISSTGEQIAFRIEGD